MHRYILNDLPQLPKRLFAEYVNVSRSTRNTDHFQRQFTTKNYCLFTIRHRGPKLWNDIVANTFSRDTVPRSKLLIKKYLKTHFTDKYL